ncbi:MAG: FkbM family methyltransferase [Pseudomonadota bacterium]
MTDPADPNARFQRAKDLIEQAKAQLTEAHKELIALRGGVQHARSRGRIQREIWTCERALDTRNDYFSEAGQDAFLDQHVFRTKRGGTFVEIGGYDGVTGSNCLFFEMRRGWNGLVVEPAPTLFEACSTARRVPCIQAALGPEPGTAEFFEVTAGLKQMGGLIATYDATMRAAVEADPRHQGRTIEVEVTTLAALLDTHGLTAIDYVSLDVEGAELSILSGFPFERYEIGAMTVENRDGAREIPDLMKNQGFQRVEALGVDDLYVSEKLLGRHKS